MECTVMYPTGMYSQLPTISSEIQIFNLGYPAIQTLYLSEQECEGLCIFVKTKRGLWAKKSGEVLH
jgi:hypothetical protein